MERKVIEIIQEIIPDKSKQIGRNSQLIEELGFDSVNILELITTIEEKFGISLQDEDLELENFKSVETILALLVKYKEKH